MTSLAQALIAIGLVLLLLSLKPTFVISQLPTEQQKGWRILFILICCFVLGYLSFLFMLMNQEITPLEMVVAWVFCGGGAFVYLITRMSQKTIHLLIINANTNLHRAHHDELTLLPKRQLLYQAMDKLIQANKPFCCMMLDLNDFKKINDRLGHDCGDWVLISVAKRIVEILPKDALVSRLGGDELAVIILGHFTGFGENMAKEIQLSISQAIAYKEESLTIGVSIGIAEFPLQGQTREQLLKQADIAMYHAKRNKITYALYEQAFEVEPKKPTHKLS
jgi:diguanylate cyclase